LGRRYRRTLYFAAWLFARIVWWEVVLRRLRGRDRVGRSRARRLRGWAREFRVMASEMGGVMIKLGQFISSRVDVLPPEVIEELAGLQDEAPTVPFPAIRQTLLEELGDPDVQFAAFDPVPVAAASLGQAHRARLPEGDRVVVKVQRPGIQALVHTDLEALRVVARWAMRLPFIARRVDVPALLDEFSGVLWEELDYRLEADNVEAFGRMFAADRGVYIPRLYRAYSTARTVTLQDVSAIKITDYARMTAAGIDRRDVARRLVNTYLWMVFVQRFYHADPHPGNLFVYPLPAGESDGRAERSGQPFYLVFVDFGMVGRLTPEIAAGLRETLVALTTRDAHRLVESYERLGVLLPGADRARIEQATLAVFDRVWGMSMAEISAMQFRDMRDLGREFRDLLFALPFQVPQDFLYLTRCVGIITGLATGLDPTYDPWHEVAPFALSLLGDEPGEAGGPGLAGLFGRESWPLLKETLAVTGRQALALPGLAYRVLDRMDRGALRVEAAPGPDLARDVDRLENAAQRVAWAVVFGALVTASAILFTGDQAALGIGGFVLSALAFLRVLLAGRG